MSPEQKKTQNADQQKGKFDYRRMMEEVISDENIYGMKKANVSQTEIERIFRKKSK